MIGPVDTALEVEKLTKVMFIGYNSVFPDSVPLASPLMENVECGWKRIALMTESERLDHFNKLENCSEDEAHQLIMDRVQSTCNLIQSLKDENEHDAFFKRVDRFTFHNVLETHHVFHYARAVVFGKETKKWVTGVVSFTEGAENAVRTLQNSYTWIMIEDALFRSLQVHKFAAVLFKTLEGNYQPFPFDEKLETEFNVAWEMIRKDQTYLEALLQTNVDGNTIETTTSEECPNP